MNDPERLGILWTLTRLGSDVFDRANFLEIGLTGNVSDPDRRVASELGLDLLSSFEKDLLKPYILEEKKRRCLAFREAVIEITGEDPEENHWL